jgi:hypothetical protein
MHSYRRQKSGMSKPETQVVKCFCIFDYQNISSYYTNCRVKFSKKGVGRVELQHRKLTSAPDGGHRHAQASSHKAKSSWQLLNGVGMGPEPRRFHKRRGSSTSRQLIPKASVSSSWCSHYRLSYPSCKELISYMKSNRIIWGPAMCVKRWWTSWITGRLCRLQHF